MEMLIKLFIKFKQLSKSISKFNYVSFAHKTQETIRITALVKLSKCTTLIVAAILYKMNSQIVVFVYDEWGALNYNWD